ncbi:MAG: glycine--tRNA ligase subunit beta [Deltaproteobacteria bacterium]|nr:glycine--tRNA ligase subunit beta [Deltaproteobacteria bacterium]MCL5792674.1 glycine--tRNA ligase subunit beta [Deltaproteobacteria bacterium]
MSELFIEIGVEEIPVNEIKPAIEHISRSLWMLFTNDHLFESESNTIEEVCQTYTTPRRLAVCFNGLADKGKPVSITCTGPRKESAYDQKGKPTTAAIGFARSKGMDVSDLKVVKLEKGEFVQLELKKPGINTDVLIREQLKDIILNIPFKKSMRWVKDGISFIRPIRWFVVLYNQRVVPVSIGEIKSSSFTSGILLENKKIKVLDCKSYLNVLKSHKIIPSFDHRKSIISDQAKLIAEDVHGSAVLDNELLDTLSNLVESPVAILGTFDSRFMNLPKEVIISVMKDHQKYIPIEKNNSELLPYFIGISNNPYGDNDVIRKGYERVLHARLEDAEFYYNEDIKQPLASYVELLKGMIFNPELGSLYDKTQRIVAVSSYLCDEIGFKNKSRVTSSGREPVPFAKGGILFQPLDETSIIMTLKAAQLCKADLATRLVSEFPELQGTIGRQYLVLENKGYERIAQAIYEHHLPKGFSPELPESLIGAVVSIADKVDTLIGFFSIGEQPTGTQDPYGLRRAVIGIINTIVKFQLELDLKLIIDFGIDMYRHINDKEKLSRQIMNYILIRLKGIIKEGINMDDMLIEAVIETKPVNIIEVEQRIKALSDTVLKKEFEPVYLAYRRAINITKGYKTSNNDKVDTSLFVESYEKDLYNKYLEVYKLAQPKLANRDYKGYIKTLETLIPHVNLFFEKVLVMTENLDVRNNRLLMLTNIGMLINQLLDITKLNTGGIYGSKE